MEQAAMRAGAVGAAAITSLAVADEEISIGAAAEYAPGIGRVDFVLVDLTREAPANVVERTDIRYPVPLPEQVSASWTASAALAAGGTYRVFFHVYDRSGVNLVAYDRRDFTRAEKGDHR
jgi:hypothetical protein